MPELVCNVRDLVTQDVDTPELVDGVGYAIVGLPIAQLSDSHLLVAGDDFPAASGELDNGNVVVNIEYNPDDLSFYVFGLVYYPDIYWKFQFRSADPVHWTLAERVENFYQRHPDGRVQVERVPTPGPRGPQGIQGIQGEQGPPGAMGESGLGTGDVTIGQLRDEIAARSEADTALGIRIDNIPDLPAPHYLGAYDNLLQQVKDSVDLGNIVLRFGRYWIVHERNNARANGPLSAVDDGWRAIDGQYRGVATVAPRVYDQADHVEKDDDLWFCRVAGSYSSAQIVVGPNWWNASGGAVDPGPGGGVTEAQLQAEVTARTEGDTALGIRIDGLPEGVTAAQLQAEIAARTARDTALGIRIDGLPDTDAQFAEEALQRSQADIALGTRIDNLPPGGINLGQATAAARAATAIWSHRDNSDQIPANKLGNAAQATARNEVLVPFRPGANPALILIQSIGYVTAADGYTEYNAPFYISDGGYTLNASEARDFSGEPHLISLLAGGGGAPAAGTIVSGDNPDLGSDVSRNLIWEPTSKRFSRVLGHSAVTQTVNWGDHALPPGHVFEAGKTYIGIAESRTDLPQVLPEASVWFLRNSNTFTTGDPTGHAEQYVPPGDLGAFGFKDNASNAVTAIGQYAAFVDSGTTGNLQVFPWQVESFVAREPAEWHLDPYVTQSLLPGPSEAQILGNLIFPNGVNMINGRAYRFDGFTSDDLVDVDVWWVEFHGGSSKSGTSGMHSGLLWRNLGASAWAIQSNGNISNISNVSTDNSISFLAGRGTASATNTSGGLNTVFYIFKREENMWIASPHWTSLFGSQQDADRVMRIMRRR